MTAALRTPRGREILDKRYELGETMGRGAYADVVDAIHIHTRQRVAVKRWRLAVDLPEDAARWKREVQAQASLDHAAIVDITDAGLDERGRPYVVMDRLNGETLRGRLERGPLGLDEALEIFDQLLDGLAFAHAAGIIHRDLKPANVFLEGSPGSSRVKLLDFGLALPIRRSLPRLTDEGVAVGTIDYMAPEQMAADASVGPPADVWAIGVMIYECLTVVRPFRSDDLRQLAAQIVTGSHAPLSQVAPHVPDIVNAIVARCLRVAVAERYPDAAVLRQAWLAARSTRAAWHGPAAHVDDEAVTGALWSSTEVPLSSFVEPAGPASRPDSSGIVIPETRPSQPVSAEIASIDLSAQTPIPETRSSTPWPQDFTDTHVLPALDPVGANLEPTSSASAVSTPTGELSFVLAGAAAMLTLVTGVLILWRDTVFVPLFSGHPEDVGEYFVLDPFWTPAINVGSGLCFLAAVGLATAAVVLHRRASRTRKMTAHGP